MGETKIQTATPRSGLRTGRVGLTRVTGAQGTPGGAQFRRRDGERLDLRHQSGSGNQQAEQDAGGVIVRDRLNLAQAPIFIVSLPTGHPFKGFRVPGTKDVKMLEGWVYGVEGTSDPLLADPKGLNIPQTTINCPDAGSIWLEIGYTKTQQSTTKGGGSRITVWRHMEALDQQTYTHYEVGSEPGPAGSGQDLHDTDADIFFRICDVDIIGGQVFVTQQYIRDNIQVPDITDAKITASV